MSTTPAATRTYTLRKFHADRALWVTLSAPGHAPVADACGLAGGTPWGAAAPEEGEYLNTTFARHGMKGTDLPPLHNGVKWKIGSTAEVSWNIRFNQ